ncbi:MAG TPA: hypothetical protein EYG70_07400 [Sulfurimonas sp.]|nr:hypothetical protein [Sulfurimonas sp.]
MFRYILSLLLLTAVVQAATITSQQDNYNRGQTMTFTVADMVGNNDWIGIYPVGSNNDWANVVAWKWTGDIVNGDIGIASIATGNYEVRAFFNNSFTVEASDSFSAVEGAVANATITTSKENYNAAETIIVTLANMAGNNNDWGNVLSWKFTNGVVNGNLSLNGIPEGEYEARAFFNNSFTLEATGTFSVGGGAVANTAIQTSKEQFTEGEAIEVTLSNMAGNNNDWVGIYPVDSNNDWGNVLSWRYTNGAINGNIVLDALPVGNYEVRAFFNNSFALEATGSFSVIPAILPPTLYEDAEDGLADWVTTAGQRSIGRYLPGFEGSLGCIGFHATWEKTDDGYWRNLSEYHLTIDNDTQKILSLNTRYKARGGHYAFGARVTTTKGVRRVIWTHFYNHSNIAANIRNYGNDVAFITFPEPGIEMGPMNGEVEREWRTYDLNIEEAIQQFEPDNILLSVDYLITTGGDFDNIMLK